MGGAMPSKPPSLRPRSIVAARKLSSWGTTRKSRQARGYGRAHELMRAQVLREEPLCRACLAAGRVGATEIADHIIPKAEGGTDDRSNYQGLCTPCSKVKTAEEALRARGLSRSPAQGSDEDGWPVDPNHPWNR